MTVSILLLQQLPLIAPHVFGANQPNGSLELIPAVTGAQFSFSVSINENTLIDRLGVMQCTLEATCIRAQLDQADRFSNIDFQLQQSFHEVQDL